MSSVLTGGPQTQTFYQLVRVSKINTNEYDSPPAF